MCSFFFFWSEYMAFLLVYFEHPSAWGGAWRGRNLMQMHDRKGVWLTYVGGSLWRVPVLMLVLGHSSWYVLASCHSLCSCEASCWSQILKLQVVKHWAFLPLPQFFLVSNTDLLPYCPHGLLAQQSTPFLTMRPTMANPWLSTSCRSHMRTEKVWEASLYPQHLMLWVTLWAGDIGFN